MPLSPVACNWTYSLTEDVLDKSFKTQHTTWLDAIAAVQYPNLEKFRDRTSTIQNNSNNTNQSELRTLNGLRVVYPANWNDDPVINSSSPKFPAYNIMHSQWENNPQRLSGIKDAFIPLEQGGKTVQGNWPDVLSGLTYIAILKNGHTHLMNTIGDLRQRLSNCSSLLLQGNETSLDVNVKIMQQGLERQQQHMEVSERIQNNSEPIPSLRGHIVFAIVRNPISRFLSGLCQDTSLRESRRRMIEQEHQEAAQKAVALRQENRVTGQPQLRRQDVSFVSMTGTYGEGTYHRRLLQQENEDATSKRSEMESQKEEDVDTSSHHLIDEALNNLRFLFKNGKKFPPHQSTQISQLMEAVGSVPVGVTLIPQEMAFSVLVEELGGNSTFKSRDRLTDLEYQQGYKTRHLCHVRPNDLTDKQVATICDIYKADLRMMELARIGVPECHQYHHLLDGKRIMRTSSSFRKYSGGQ